MTVQSYSFVLISFVLTGFCMGQNEPAVKSSTSTAQSILKVADSSSVVKQESVIESAPKLDAAISETLEPSSNAIAPNSASQVRRLPSNPPPISSQLNRMVPRHQTRIFLSPEHESIIRANRISNRYYGHNHISPASFQQPMFCVVHHPVAVVHTYHFTGNPRRIARSFRRFR